MIDLDSILAAAGARVEPADADRAPVLDMVLCVDADLLQGLTIAEIFARHVWTGEPVGAVAAMLSCEPYDEAAQAVKTSLRSQGWFVRLFDKQQRWFPPESSPDEWVLHVLETMQNSPKGTAPVLPEVQPFFEDVKNDTQTE